MPIWETLVNFVHATGVVFIPLGFLAVKATANFWNESPEKNSWRASGVESITRPGKNKTPGEGGFRRAGYGVPNIRARYSANIIPLNSVWCGDPSWLQV